MNIFKKIKTLALSVMALSFIVGISNAQINSVYERNKRVSNLRILDNIYLGWAGTATVQGIPIKISTNNAASGDVFSLFDGSISWRSNNTLTLETQATAEIKRRRNDSSTGILYGGLLSVHAPDSFDISAGSGVVVDNTTDPRSPTETLVQWALQDGVAVTYIAAADTSWIGINSAGAIVQQTTMFTEVQLRSIIYLGYVGHSSRSTVSFVVNEQRFVANIGAAMFSLAEAIGGINVSGNVYSANGANLKLNRSAGETWKPGINYKNSYVTPDRILTVSSAAASWTYIWRDTNTTGNWGYILTTNTIDASRYDINSEIGALADVTAGKFTIQYLYFYPETLANYVQYGQALYDSLALAIAAIDTPYEESILVSDALFRGWLIVAQGATDLSSAASASFISAGKFGNIAPAGGGSATGEVNTASNLGAGHGWYKNKAGVDLQFLSALEGSNKLSMTSDDTNVTIDVVEANIVHQNLSGKGDNTHAQIDALLMATTKYAYNIQSTTPTYATRADVDASTAAIQGQVTVNRTDINAIFVATDTERSARIAGDAARLPASSGTTISAIIAEKLDASSGTTIAAFLTIDRTDINAIFVATDTERTARIVGDAACLPASSGTTISGLIDTKLPASSGTTISALIDTKLNASSCTAIDTLLTADRTDINAIFVATDTERSARIAGDAASLPASSGTTISGLIDTKLPASSGTTISALIDTKLPASSGTTISALIDSKLNASSSTAVDILLTADRTDINAIFGATQTLTTNKLDKSGGNMTGTLGVSTFTASPGSANIFITTPIVLGGITQQSGFNPVVDSSAPVWTPAINVTTFIGVATMTVTLKGGRPAVVTYYINYHNEHSQSKDYSSEILNNGTIINDTHTQSVPAVSYGATTCIFTIQSTTAGVNTFCINAKSSATNATQAVVDSAVTIVEY